MTDEHDHASCVAAWRRSVGGDALATSALLRAFEDAFRAIWRRAQVTLGDITLMAIGDRVLHDAVEVHPVLRQLRLEPTGITCEDLERDAPMLDAGDLDRGVRFVLVDLLTVLGRLTADVLTPALHAELSADRDGDQEPAP